jgi:hypothetical protein
MIIEFDEAHEGKSFTIDSSKAKGNLKDLTGYELEDWCRLSGLVDLPPFNIKKHHFHLTGEYPIVRLSIARHPAVIFQMRYDIKDKILYVVNFIILKQMHQNYGHAAFKRFLAQAPQMGIKNLECHANAGPSKWGVPLNGYITWGKFGLTMNPDSHKKFLSEIKEDGRAENCLQKLFLTESGQKYWLQKKMPWRAEFDLASDSINQRMFRIYEHKKEKKQKSLTARS